MQLESKTTDKLLRIAPAIIFFLLILYPIYTYLLFPSFFLFLTFLFFIYFLYRSFIFSIGTALGYKRYIWESKEDWGIKTKELEKELKLSNNKKENKKFELPEHLIVIPVHKEEFPIIKRLINSIIDQNYPQEKIYISVSIENREDYSIIENQIYTAFKEIFKDRLKVFKHILDNSKEVPGASANRTNGTKKYVEYINSITREDSPQSSEVKFNLSNFLITSPDVDTVLSKQYLSRVSYEYLKDKDKLESEKETNHYFYQTGVYTFDNNLWEVPTLIRILSSGLTMSILSSSYFHGKKRFTFSCFTMKLEDLIAADYWDTTIPIDDTPMHFRMYRFFKGKWQCRPIFIPITVDAIHSENYLLTHLKQYEQFYRWGWGIIAFPMAVRSIINTHRLSLRTITELFRIFEIFFLIKVFPLIITTILLINSLLLQEGENIRIIENNSNNYSLNSLLITAITVITNINLILLLPIIIYKYKLVKKTSKMKDLVLSIVIVLEVPLGFINLVTYGIIPYVHAAAAMCFGKRPEKLIKWSVKYSSPIKNSLQVYYAKNKTI